MLCTKLKLVLKNSSQDVTSRTDKLVLHVDANWTESAWQCISNTTM